MVRLPMLSLSLIARYFQGELPASAIDASVGTVPVAQLGGSIPICLIEDQPLVVTAANVRTLLRAYLAGELSVPVVGYVADALGLSECVEYAPVEVQDVLECTTDPAVNGPLDEAMARALLEQLAGLPPHA